MLIFNQLNYMFYKQKLSFVIFLRDLYQYIMVVYEKLFYAYLA